MSYRGIIAVAVLGLALLGGCDDHTYNLCCDEVAYLTEDVVDLMTIVMQTGENAFVGDPWEIGDIVDPGGPGNDYRATYDLPPAQRIGLGYGSGRVALRVVEDGVPRADPLLFLFATTTANVVDLSYELRYDGETAPGRLTEVDFTATLHATRAGPLDPFVIEYAIDGFCWLGDTYCEMGIDFVSPGRPRDGIDPTWGGGFGVIDDLDVHDVFYPGIYYFPDSFVAEGDVGCCAYYKQGFLWSEVW